MGDFDRAARAAAEVEPEAVVRRLPIGLPLRFREWTDSRMPARPGERDLTADRVAVLADEAAPDQPWLLGLEFQAEHDPDKLDITLAEAGRLRRDLRHGEDRRGKYRVLVGMIYLRGSCPEPVLDMTVPGNLGTYHAPLIWNVAADVAREALETFTAGQTTWGILFWVPLMQGSGDAAIVVRWKELAAALPERRDRGSLARVALVFAELAGCLPAWKQGLEGWDMTESQVVKEWMEEARREERLRTRRADLIRVLRARFANSVGQEVLDLITAQDSDEILQEWLDAASSSGTWDDFLAVLRR
jgi:hypothetical protein